jgi:hypothetical protein
LPGPGFWLATSPNPHGMLPWPALAPDSKDRVAAWLTDTLKISPRQDLEVIGGGTAGDGSLQAGLPPRRSNAAHPNHFRSCLALRRSVVARETVRSIKFRGQEKREPLHHVPARCCSKRRQDLYRGGFRKPSCCRPARELHWKWFHEPRLDTPPSLVLLAPCNHEPSRHSITRFDPRIYFLGRRLRRFAALHAARVLILFEFAPPVLPPEGLFFGPVRWPAREGRSNAHPP